MLAIVERRAKPKAERFYRPIRGRDAPCLFALFPSTSYWATFTESLPPSPAGNRGATGGLARAANRSAANSRPNRSAAFGPSTSCLTTTGAPVLSISQTRDLGLLRSLCTRRGGPNSALSSSPKGTSDHIRGFSHIPQGGDSDDSQQNKRRTRDESRH
jgi:hypothetical protein